MYTILEKRNIHFYVNKCGYHNAEYYNQYHKEEDDTDQMGEFADIEYFEDFFRFEKVMSFPPKFE